MAIKLKLCGLTTEAEAAYVNEAKADFAGFIQFFPKSKRNISTEKAKSIMKHLNPEVTPVAVVVSPTWEQLQEIEAAGFGMIQIHGQLSDELLSKITLPVLKAFNVKDLSEYEKYHANEKIVGYVFDAQVPGSGKSFDWSILKGIPRDEKLALLAGGIGAENAQLALASADVDGIDASSSIENDNGIGKNREKILALARAVGKLS